MNELVPQNITPKDVFVPNGLDVIISGIKQKIKEFGLKEFDINNESDRDEIKSFAYQITRSKTFVDGKGKDYVAKLKIVTKEIDAERKRFRDIIETLQVDVRKPVTEWEESEAKRIEVEREFEIYLMEWDEAIEIDTLFNREKAIAEKEAEFARIAEEARQKEEAARVAQEQAEHDERLKKEAIEQAEKAAQEKIEIERQRAIKAEQDAEEALAQADRNRIAFLERAKIEKENAEKARIEAARQAEIDKQKAIELAIRQSEERARIAKEAADRKAAEEKAIADKKAENKKHQATVNNRIIADFIKCGWAEAEAKAVVVAVATGKIPDLFIKY